MLSSELIEQVRSATEIVELVSQYVTLKRSGRSYKGLCPFHTEKTPSFTVSPDRQAFYCFGCQKGGDAFSFLMEHDGVSFVEAVRQLGQRVGITVEVERVSGAHDALYEAAERAAAFFEHTLWTPQGKPARRYLEKRGITREIAERFRLGMAPDAWESLAPALAESGISEETLLQLGLVARRPSGGTYDLFRNRVLFPIQSLSGRVIGFGGRLLPGTADESAPKYVNSADSPIYHKQRVLYGLAESRGAIRRQEMAVITEGYMDYLALHQAGIENVVAACGTAFGPQQAALLHRYAHRAYILGDSDPAGRRAAVRTAGLLLEHGFLVHLVELPSGHDPDTFVRENGAAAMETRLREAPGYVAYMKGLVDRRAGDLAVKERVVQHLIGDLGRISDPLLQELYSKELCRSFGLTESTVATALRQRRAPSVTRSETTTQAAASADVTESVPARLQEARSGMLRLGLTAPEWGARLVDEFEPEDFAPGPERRVFEAMQRAGDGGRWRDFVESSEDDSHGTAIEIQGPLPGEPERLYQDYRTCLLEHRFEAVKAELEKQMSEAESRGDDAMVRRLTEARQALAQDRRSLRAPMTRQGDAGGGS
jgi:DNA primase